MNRSVFIVAAILLVGTFYVLETSPVDLSEHVAALQEYESVAPASTVIPVTNIIDLKEAIEGAAGGEVRTVIVGADIEFDNNTITIPIGREITLLSDGERTLSGGNRSTWDPAFRVDGILNLGEEDRASDAEGSVTISGFQSTIWVYGSGTFVMNYGQIRNNGTSWGNITDSGVVVFQDAWSSGVFIMRGGTISENAGRGVFAGGTFIMTGGVVERNSAHMGGGVNVGHWGEFIMDGGTIRYNQGVEGGGVTVDGGGTFIFQSGEITKNVAYDSGGGVYARQGGVFYIRGGKISENLAEGSGGAGVQIHNGARLYMTGGVIEDNISQSFGGGVGLNWEANFEMDGGVIRNNTALLAGGGVMVHDMSSFQMISGVIERNTAQVIGGGGVVVHLNSILEIYGGAISNNTSDRDGGGVLVVENYDEDVFEACNDPAWGCSRLLTEFNMYGGEITNNTAGRNGGAIFTTNFANINIFHNARFAGNTASAGSFWLEDYLASAVYNPGTPITVDTLMGLQGDTINWASVSESPMNNARPFSGLINNFDLNFVGQEADMLPLSVTFMSNDGTGRSVVIRLDYNQSIAHLPTFVREGYGFLRWTEEYDGTGMVFDADTVTNRNIVVYAQWARTMPLPPNTGITSHSPSGARASMITVAVALGATGLFVAIVRTLPILIVTRRTTRHLRRNNKPDK